MIDNGLTDFAIPMVLAQQERDGSFMPVILIWGLIFAAMWFLIVAPHRKRQKEHQKLVSEVSTGDHVLTTGGIYGVVTNVKDDRFVVKIAENTKIELNKNFVQNVEKESS